MSETSPPLSEEQVRQRLQIVDALVLAVERRDEVRASTLPGAGPTHQQVKIKDRLLRLRCRDGGCDQKERR